MTSELAQRRPQSVAEHATVDYTAALQHLGLRANDPKAHALILVCQRYQLDPLLGHVSIYKDRPYIHFAGYLHLANAHPAFAGIETVREWEDDRYCHATVRVHRSDRGFPFERTGKSLKAKPKQGGGTYADDDADAKAFAQACRRALRMAFNVDHPDPAEDEGAGPTPAPAPVVEVARRVDQMHESSRQPSDPAPSAPPRQAGSDPTSEAAAVPATPASHTRGAPSDPKSPEPNPATTASAGSGAPTSPASPGDAEPGRRTRDATKGKGGEADPPPAGPNSDEAEQAAFDERLADDDAGRWAR